MPFSHKEKEELKVHFDSFDKDHSGSITLEELRDVMKSIGETATDAQIKQIISEVDSDNNGTIEFSEFLDFVEKFKAGKGSKGFGEVFLRMPTSTSLLLLTLLTAFLMKKKLVSLNTSTVL
jgi:hypothetical protein